MVFRLKLSWALVAAAFLAALGEEMGLLSGPEPLFGALVTASLSLSLAFVGIGLMRRP